MTIYWWIVLQSIEQGFKNAIAGANRAIVVTTPEVSAVRDADRIIGLLEANEVRNPKLLINRVRQDMVKRGDMMSIDDIIDILAIDLIGVVPDDEKIIVSTNKGEPAVVDNKSLAGQAYRSITKRIMGQDVPLLNLENEEGFMFKIKVIWFEGKLRGKIIFLDLSKLFCKPKKSKDFTKERLKLVLIPRQGKCFSSVFRNK